MIAATATRQQVRTPVLGMDARVKWALIAGNYTLVVLISITQGISFDLSSVTPFIPAFLILLGIITFYSTIRPNAQFVSVAMTLLQICFFTPSVIFLSYGVATLDFPFIDDRLISIDHMLGFDWLAFLRLVNDMPLFGLILHYAYQSPLFQTLAITLILPFLGHTAHVERWFLAFMISSIAAALLSGPFAAVAAYIHLDVARDAYANLSPAASFVHIDILTKLRATAVGEFSLSHLEGIVTFPSFHATMCFLYAYGLRPVRPLFIAACALNGLMLISCLTEGGHYLTDVLAGSALALVSIPLAAGLHRRYTAAAANKPRRVRLDPEPGRPLTRS